MKFGIYVHIPFCATRCNYCHFLTRLYNSRIEERYWKAVMQEIEHYVLSEAFVGEVDSIYFGGGTPSIVPAEHIPGILATCRKAFDVAADCEISLEANPGTTTEAKIREYVSAGINRLSFGAQTMDSDELRAIRRDHTPEKVGDSVLMARENGILNVNLDFMMGLPEQTEASWSRNLRSIDSLAPTHLSIYMLDLDTESPLKRSLAAGKVRVPDDDTLADWYVETIRSLESRGFGQYEISNFAKTPYQCRHNLKYWRMEPVLGFGVGSHSYDGHRRYANITSLQKYMECAESKNSPVTWSTSLNAARRLEETLFLGLRLNNGLNWNDLRNRFGQDRLSAYELLLKNRAANGLVEWHDESVRLTTAGMLLSNEIFQELVT